MKVTVEVRINIDLKRRQRCCGEDKTTWTREGREVMTKQSQGVSIASQTSMRDQIVKLCMKVTGQAGIEMCLKWRQRCDGRKNKCTREGREVPAKQPRGVSMTS